MSLGDALSIAMAGLRANQASMSLVSSNVANAETPGYIRKTVDQVVTNNGQTGTGVQINGINRQLDDYVLAQLRTETSGASYASLRNDFLQQLQGLYGNPNSTGTLEDAFKGLTTAMQALASAEFDDRLRDHFTNRFTVAPFLDRIRRALGDRPLIAEDLGYITADVAALRGVPGIAGVITGKAIYEGRFTVVQAVAELAR